LRSADDDKRNAITAANDEEHVGTEKGLLRTYVKPELLVVGSGD